ncbi:protein of unknown function DUF1023 [Segniliparus rotundus DSM 44985]|uniref:DUF1023 domain-containing protein n=1 Tax=Segniliparus rotundus (strain ATCC BAA-972 / CDC 1076 / CIP 108378 / DSM 44985 / JCM 13578) TaxID=640132 RepID=D6ZEJ1_SEGRD|nr:alpha/beta hydrolase [Segniliparus rotundus]ADG99467.1 protein of unknown function DUF1023 [Segniliparus rotundus DSM 44985]
MSAPFTRALLEKLDPSVLSTAAQALQSRAGKIADEQAQFPKRLRFPAGGQEWTGAASDALRERAEGFGRTYGAEHAMLLHAAETYKQAGGYLSESANTARQFVAGVEGMAMFVASPDGSQTWDCGEPFEVAQDFAVHVKPGSVPSGAPWQVGQLLQFKAQELTQDLKNLVGQLEDLGREWGAKVREAMDFNSLALDANGHPYTPYDPDKTAHDTAKGIADGVIPIPKDPYVLRDLWSKLNEDEKNNIYKRYPDIGNHGGIPVDPPDHLGRDHYNKENLKRIRAEKQAQLDDLNRHAPDWGPDNLPMGSAAYQDWKRKTDELRHEIDGLDNLKRTLGNSNPPRFLTFVDGKGHAALAINNSDYAKKVDTFVPGTGQDLSRMGICDGHAQDMEIAARNADPTLKAGDVSVTTWMCYDRPMTAYDPITGQLDGSDQWAGDPKFAKDGAPYLSEYQAGIRASHDDEHLGRAHQTVIGHSYGASVVGAAATGGNHLDADAVIQVGSPGAFAASASELDLNPNARVFDALAENDVIKVANAGDGVGVHPLGVDPHTWTDVTKFKTDPGPDGYGTGLSLDAHSSYFEPGSEGLKNIGKIIDGQEPEHE